MAEDNSTAPKAGEVPDDLKQAVEQHLSNMDGFFELAEREIDEHNDTDWDGIKFLMRAVKAEYFNFSGKYCEIQEKIEGKPA